MSFYEIFFSDAAHCVRGAERYSSKLDNAVGLLQRVRDRGAKVIIAGNGASAAIASHVSVDLTKSAAVRSINFNEADLITCFANDYGYEFWLQKAIEAYADYWDVVILISSSGTSKNIINAALKAKEMKLSLITFSGMVDDNPLMWIGDINFFADSPLASIVQLAHQTWLLAIIEKIISDRRST